MHCDSIELVFLECVFVIFCNFENALERPFFKVLFGIYKIVACSRFLKNPTKYVFFCNSRTFKIGVSKRVSKTYNFCDFTYEINMMLCVSSSDIGFCGTQLSVLLWSELRYWSTKIHLESVLKRLYVKFDRLLKRKLTDRF